MNSESRPLLLSTTATRQTYLTCPESVDPIYHPTEETCSIHRCSSFSTSIFQAESVNIQQERRSSKDSITETLHDDEFEPSQQQQQTRRRQPTDSIAYVQRLEKFFNSFSSSLYLENTVAVARDHMANERTFLAWVRTSLSTISIGVAITQLFRLDKDILKDPDMADDLVHIGRPLGMSFIVIGILYMVFACIRYFHSQVAMTKGYFPASRGIVLFTAISILVALIAVFAVVLKRK